MPRKKIALCVGINTYPSAPLNGCVNDAHDWAGLLERHGYSPTLILDNDATRLNILSTLEAMIRSARFGDRIVFTYSGHGTWLPDMDGDEPDGRDEALCPIDYDSSAAGAGLITDDDLQKLVSLKRFGVRVTIISDSCHSGTVSRFASLTALMPDTGGPRPKARFIDPLTFLDGDALSRARAVAGSDAYLRPRNSAGAVLFSGCADEEFSYDAWIDGRYNGAFTYHAIKTLTLNPGMSYLLWHNMVRRYLPSGAYPQTPQFWGSVWQRGYTL